MAADKSTGARDALCLKFSVCVCARHCAVREKGRLRAVRILLYTESERNTKGFSFYFQGGFVVPMITIESIGM